MFGNILTTLTQLFSDATNGYVLAYQTSQLVAIILGVTLWSSLGFFELLAIDLVLDELNQIRTGNFWDRVRTHIIDLSIVMALFAPIVFAFNMAKKGFKSAQRFYFRAEMWRLTETEPWVKQDQSLLRKLIEGERKKRLNELNDLYTHQSALEYDLKGGLISANELAELFKVAESIRQLRQELNMIERLAGIYGISIMKRQVLVDTKAAYNKYLIRN